MIHKYIILHFSHALTISDWIKLLLECIDCNIGNNYKMIDVSQWRASIGLWNYCQAASRGSIIFNRPASSGPASECSQDQLIKATTEDSESDSTGYIQEEKRCTLPAVLLIIGFIVIYFCFLLLKHSSIPPPGKSIAILHKYIIHCMYH